jgi:predicted  nucleic acid-binding Zn-ribbon protein
MSHHEGAPSEDAYYVDPKDVLSQYSVEWVSLRKSYDEIKNQLLEVQADLSRIDRQLENGEITEHEHIKLYREKWSESTQIVQVKREVESRLYEIQKEIRAANRQLKQAEEERRRRERIEQEKANAMIEWMSLKQGFDLVTARRNEINTESDKLEIRRRNGSISDEEYRENRILHIRQLAELSTVESDVKRRLAELLEIIRR